MQFIKMHGAGNDYVYIDGFQQALPDDVGELARRMSHRRFGVGADGLIAVLPPQSGGDARMRMWNADGSEAEMCGNGIRCVAKLVYDRGHCRTSPMRIETGSGTLTVELELSGERVQRVTVDMGEPIFEPQKIPTTLSGERIVHQPLTIAGQTLHVTCLSMGNPHCVVFVPELTDQLVLGLGPKIEMDPRFPQRTNVEFVQVLSRSEVLQRTWERGSGETWACGTGASAVCVAGVLTGNTDRQLLVRLLGGELSLNWSGDSGRVFMTGGATEVFVGQWEV
jgi:diaminopimelate epimerase